MFYYDFVLVQSGTSFHWTHKLWWSGGPWILSAKLALANNILMF